MWKNKWTSGGYFLRDLWGKTRYRTGTSALPVILCDDGQMVCQGIPLSNPQKMMLANTGCKWDLCWRSRAFPRIDPSPSRSIAGVVLGWGWTHVVTVDKCSSAVHENTKRPAVSWFVRCEPTLRCWLVVLCEIGWLIAVNGQSAEWMRSED